MKTIKSYIVERLISKRPKTITEAELKRIVDIICNILKLEDYVNNEDSSDNINDIKNGIKEGVLISEITVPCLFTNQSYYDELLDYDIDADAITPIQDKYFNKAGEKINHKNGEKVFESNDTYGLNIYVNEYGMRFSFYQDDIFVIDKNSELLKYFDVDEKY